MVTLKKWSQEEFKLYALNMLQEQCWRICSLWRDSVENGTENDKRMLLRHVEAHPAYMENTGVSPIYQV